VLPFQREKGVCMNASVRITVVVPRVCGCESVGYPEKKKCVPVYNLRNPIGNGTVCTISKQFQGIFLYGGRCTFY